MMKKMKREHKEIRYKVDYGGGSSSSGSRGEASSMAAAGKSKLWEEEQDAAGMDEHLAGLGYKVRLKDMADVAQQLEQLDMVIGSAQEYGVSQLSDTVHYNPSDMSGWIQSLLSEFNPLPTNNLDPIGGFQNHPIQSVIYKDDSEYDLRAIPGVAAYPPDQFETENSRKRMRISTTGSGSGSVPLLNSSSSPVGITTELTRPVVLVDSQEAGVRLVHTLMACAEAVHQVNLKLGDALLKHVGILTSSQTGAMTKVATYFAEGLARRIYGIYPQDCLDASYSDLLQMHFYESCPYLKFAHFTANQAILEAFATANRVHVIDFGLKQGMQWPALIQAFACRPGGPPAFRLTGIGPPQPENPDALQQVGWKLAQFAETLGVEFEFREVVVNSLADLEPEMLDIRSSEVETVAVNSIFELHRLLAQPGHIGKVLNSIKAMNPKIITIVEQEADHNSPVFLDRFNEALHYYSSLFDSLEGASGSGTQNEDLIMSELYLGRQICNVVACEGADRVERHETVAQWRSRMVTAEFEPVHLGSDAFKQASMLLALYTGGDGYRVEENNGCLMLGWHTRPLITTSAWKLAAVK